MTTSESIKEIAGAMAQAQGELTAAKKDAINPAFRSKYADLTAVWEAIRPTLSKHGIAVFQEPVTVEKGVAVTTLLAHKSGEWIRFDPLTVPMAKQDAHGVGSATSYAKRYSLSSAIGVVTDEDDDGNGAAKSNGHAAAVVVKAPEGYASWLTDMQAVADEGVERLRDEWKTQPEAFRHHLTTHDGTTYEALRARAKAPAKKLVTA
jgi:hypothetical protein